VSEGGREGGREGGMINVNSAIFQEQVNFQ
jgi:hypothetical protein